MTRIFYVDAALSITSKIGKKYWKCSVVENGENILNFANSVVNKTIISKKNGKKYQTGTNAAEAFTILKLVLWLAEQKWQGSIQIFTDNSNCVRFCQKNKNAKKFKPKSDSAKYLSLACETAQKKNIDLDVSWIKGTENPADYYSRCHSGKPTTCSQRD